ncbi:HAD family hydrolase [Porticoccaceae bacterium]|nr:HAD family hydrolase [Porticoccaceae bacterium]
MKGASRLDHLIFDLDGTLVDSAESIRSALIESCKVNNIEPMIPISEIKIGPMLDEIISSILPYEESSRHDLFKKTFVELYDRKFSKECMVYPGMIDALSQVAINTNLFLVTNKRIIPTVKILRHHSIAQFFKAIIGCDSVENNGCSKAKSINYLINKYGLSKSDCTYFGDTEGDAAACYEVGIKFVYVSWGYGDAKEMANLSCLTMNGWDELCGFIGKVQLAE